MPGVARERPWQPIPHRIPAVPANSIPVTNCDDSGAGSLRQALADAVDGDTIDLTGTGCSIITLTTGSIFFTQSDITLQGPGAADLIVSGGDRYTPLLHSGTGTLAINDLTVADGHKYFTNAQVDDARGGCIFSYGTVSLSGAEVKYCTAENVGAHSALGGAVYAATSMIVSNSYILGSAAVSPNHPAGGGIFSPGPVSISHSTISGNTAFNGGGVWAGGGLYMKYSTVSDNRALGADIETGGGGINASGNVDVQFSTISGNQSGRAAGIMVFYGGTTLLLNSTISGNYASYIVGGAYFWANTGGVTVANCTIAFNTEGSVTGGGGGIGAVSRVIDLESSIVFDNTAHGIPDDLRGPANGSNNIIGSSQFAPPPDTISADPQLLPLAWNGGRTQTHALRDTSPAIDAGNDSSGVAEDQRGSGFPRIVGAGPDIGAFELDTGAIILADGFDGG